MNVVVRGTGRKGSAVLLEIDPEVFDIFIWSWMGLGLVVFGSLFFISAPYGRHERDGWGPKIPSRVGWILMEAPSALIMLTFFVLSERNWDRSHGRSFCWQVHYIHRSFIYPFRCRTAGKYMPASIALMAIVFNGVNASTNGLYLFHFQEPVGNDWFSDPRFLIGAALFVGGMVLNITSDNILLRLRAERGANEGYSIPKGGMYRWISSPNYLGEMLEWIGFAIATWSLPALAFAVWTVANLAPRAAANHAWYKRTFPDYPPERRALIPGLY